MTQPWPISVTSLGAASAGAVLWRTQGGPPQATVIVKATFKLVPDHVAVVIAPDPIAREDRRRPAPSSLDEAGETAPFLPGARVVLRGTAWVPDGGEATSAQVRLAIFRDRWIVDKTLRVVGDRFGTLDDPSDPRPFRSMPIVYERAFGGPYCTDNPVGVGADPDCFTLPNVEDPGHPQVPAGFGPIPRGWGPRRKRSPTPDQRRALALDVPSIPEDFDWRWFSPAPADQELDALRGDEWICLEGLNRDRFRVQSRLPSARGVARVIRGRAPPRPLTLTADTLVIDADRLRCSILWRGSIGLEATEPLDAIRVLGAVELPDEPVVWPGDRTRGAPAMLDGTLELRLPPELLAHRPPIAPFTLAAPGARANATAAAIPGAPWAAPALRPPTLDDEDSVETTGIVDPGTGDPARTKTAAPPSAPGAVALPFLGSPAVPRFDGGLPFAPVPRAEDTPGRTPTFGLPFAPVPAFGGPPLVAPPDLVIAPPPLVPAPSALPSPPPAPLAALRPEPAPPLMPTPQPPAPPPADAPAPTGIRATVQARLAKGESLLGLELAGANLAGLDLHGVGLSRANLKGSRLDGCDLHGADLTEADLTGADLAGADLTGADLAGADLTRGSLAGAKLDDANLRGANLGSAKGPGASFARANLEGADLRLSRFTDANFADADLRHITAGKADLSRARFSRAKLGGAALRAAKLKQADLRDADLEAADLRDADLERANVHGAKRTSAKMGGANLKDLIESALEGDGEPPAR